MSQNLWTAVHDNKPTDLPSSASAEAKAARSAEQAEFKKKEESVLGTMYLLCDPGAWVHITEKVTASGAWNVLKIAYATPGLSVIFADFKQAVGFRLTGANLAAKLECDRLQGLLDHLMTNKVTLSELLKAMILINAIPNKWDNAASHLLLNHSFDDLKFANVHKAIISEYERGTKQPSVSNDKGKGANLAAHISVVKHKANPQLSKISDHPLTNQKLKTVPDQREED